MIRKLLRGDVKLYVAYWGYGVLVAVIYRALDLLLQLNYFKIIKFSFSLPLIYVFIALPFIYFPFIYIAIWRSANKYTGRKSWAVLAKIAVGIGSIFLVMNFISLVNIFLIKPPH
jgi:hypothetical protein